MTQAPPAGRNILIVDDDLVSLEQLSSLARLRGFEASAALDGAQALELLRRVGGTPDLILLDLAMPGMDGRAFMDELRRDGRLRQLPVVIISGKDHPELAHSVQGFVRKPLDVERLWAVVNEALSLSRPVVDEAEELLLVSVLTTTRFAETLHRELSEVLSALQSRPRASLRLIETIAELESRCAQLGPLVDRLKNEVDSSATE